MASNKQATTARGQHQRDETGQNNNKNRKTQTIGVNYSWSECLTACGCHQQATPCGCHQQATPCGCHQQATPCGCHQQATPCGCHQQATPCGCHQQATPCGCHQQATDCTAIIKTSATFSLSHLLFYIYIVLLIVQDFNIRL